MDEPLPHSASTPSVASLGKPNAAPAKLGRILSVDALRGFDMLWILGLSEAVRQILQALFPNAGWVEVFVGQLKHVPWSGFAFYDLIFPLFLFLSGLSMAIALPRRLEREGRRSTQLHLLERALVLFLLGVFYNGGIANGWEKIRWMGVLQRIGIASVVAGFLSLRLSTQALLWTAAGLLVAYSIPFYLVPVPGTGATGFELKSNLANYLDSVLLPGRLNEKTWDPEGLLSTLPAIASAVLGLLAGRWLLSGAVPARIVGGLMGAGVAAILVGTALHPVLPVIKKIWTPSFVFVTSGCSAVLLGLFYWMIDVRGWRVWSQPFLWIGANPIAFYLLFNLQLFHRVGDRLFSKAVQPQPWVAPTVTVLVVLWLGRWLYRNQIFFRI